MKILVLGRQGQLASSLYELHSMQRDSKDHWQFASSEEFNLLYPEKISDFLNHANPDIIVNTAAYTAVDKAETDREAAHLINAESPGAIAAWCAHSPQKTFIHFSTDYVYPGTGENPWSETDIPEPQNYYGVSKLAGEYQILATQTRAFIFRTSWVYHSTGNNFVRTMLRLAKERPELKIVGDQKGAPTAALDLARFIMDQLPQLTNENRPSGVYNLCAQGVTSWADFASEIFSIYKELDSSFQPPKITKITSQEYPTPAKRPLNSRMNSNKLQQHFGTLLPLWNVSLRKCLERIYGS